MKVIGSCTVMLASFGFGLRYLWDKRRRLQLLRELCDSLSLLSGELSLRRTPLPELMAWCSAHSSNTPHSFFQCLAISSDRLGSKSFSELWEDAARLCLTELTDIELRELISLGKTLGRTELSQQIAALESCRNLFLETLRREEGQYRDQRMLSFGIPMSLGALLSILLL